jgi:hypothetical protein
MRDFPERWREKLCALLADIVTLERAVNLICDRYFDGHDVLFKDSRGELTSSYEVAELLVADVVRGAGWVNTLMRGSCCLRVKF